MQTTKVDAGTVEKQTARKLHWEAIYSNKDSRQVSWFKPHLESSLRLIERTRVGKAGEIINVGAGASSLVDDLLAAGYEHITALDISLKAIETMQARLGVKKEAVSWIEDDITQVVLPPNQYDLWHDRAVFHFLTSIEDRKRYVETATRSLKSGGHLIIATFALEGPLRCSGLDVKRYSGETLQSVLGQSFKLIESTTEKHITPFNTEQQFLYCRFRKN